MPAPAAHPKTGDTSIAEGQRQERKRDAEFDMPMWALVHMSSILSFRPLSLMVSSPGMICNDKRKAASPAGHGPQSRMAPVNPRYIPHTCLPTNKHTVLFTQEKTCEPWLLHDFERDFYGEQLRLVVRLHPPPHSLTLKPVGTVVVCRE